MTSSPILANPWLIPMIGFVITLVGLVSFCLVRTWEWRNIETKTSQRMTIAVLTARKFLPHAQLLDFLYRGISENAVHEVLSLLHGKTYQEWFEYFETKDFQANYREVPILSKVLHAFYQGMVLEAEDAATSWQTLPESERQKYKWLALEFAKRNREYSLGAILEGALGSVLMFHNFFREVSVQDRLLDQFVVIIFEAVARKQAVSDEESNLLPYLSHFGSTQSEQIQKNQPAMEWAESRLRQINNIRSKKQ